MSSSCFNYYVYSGGCEELNFLLVNKELYSILLVLILFSIEGIITFVFIVYPNDNCLFFVVTLLVLVFWCSGCVSSEVMI